jgi:hypothetical protein
VSATAPALPSGEKYPAASDPPRVHLVLVVGRRVFVYPTEPAARKPRSPLGKPLQVVVGHGVTAPAWIVDATPATPAVSYTLVDARGACTDPGRERLLVGIQRIGDASPDAVDWHDAVELKGCALKADPPAGGIYWDHFAVEGAHKEARFVSPRAVEGADADAVKGWLKRYLAGENPYKALKEKPDEVALSSFEGIDGVRFIKTYAADGSALGVSTLLRVVQGDKVLGTLRDGSADGALVLGARRFVLVSQEASSGEKRGAYRLYEIAGGGLLDAGEIKSPRAR